MMPREECRTNGFDRTSASLLNLILLFVPLLTEPVTFAHAYGTDKTVTRDPHASPAGSVRGWNTAVGRGTPISLAWGVVDERAAGERGVVTWRELPEWIARQAGHRALSQDHRLAGGAS